MWNFDFLLCKKLYFGVNGSGFVKTFSYILVYRQELWKYNACITKQRKHLKSFAKNSEEGGQDMAEKVKDINENQQNKNDIIINVEHLNKKFVVDKQPMEVLRDINLQVKKGEFITIVGHSGCGKSTLLK